MKVCKPTKFQADLTKHEYQVLDEAVEVLETILETMDEYECSFLETENVLVVSAENIAETIENLELIKQVENIFMEEI